LRTLGTGVNIKERVQRYLETADRLRARSKQVVDDTLRAHYIDVAKAYEQLAADLVAQAQKGN
jgi:hypothetical protein